MKLVDIQPIGNELAVRWDDGAEQFIGLETLRKACPCAGCAGETDVMGNVAKGPEVEMTPTSFQVQHLHPIGGYAVQVFWKDGHNSGLYSHELLHTLGD